MNAPVVIIGGGPAGLVAALWAGRLGLESVLISPQLGGQLRSLHHPIVDYPGIPEIAAGALADRLIDHARSFGLHQIAARVAGIEPGSVVLEDGRSQAACAVLLATGARDRRLGLSGEVRLRGRGIGQRVSRDGPAMAGRVVAVVGGGDTAFENARTLAARCPRVHLIHRGTEFRARAEFVEPVLALPNVTIHTRTRLLAVEGAEALEALQLTGPAGTWRLPVGGLFIRIGVEPVLDMLPQGKRDALGYLAVDGQQATSVAGVWAAGDVCTPQASSIVASCGQAMVAIKAIERFLAR